MELKSPTNLLSFFVWMEEGGGLGSGVLGMWMRMWMSKKAHLHQ